MAEMASISRLWHRAARIDRGPTALAVADAPPAPKRRAQRDEVTLELPPEKPPLISANALRKVYRLGSTDVEALRGVSLTVEEGEFVAIIGPSGSGKSTLLNMLGLVEAPTDGELYVDGRRTSHLSDRERAALRLRTIGFVFQTFNLLPNLTALQNVIMPMRLAGMSRRLRKRRAEDLLKAVGLGARLKHRPVELSGGERQRVAIARSLANWPRLILADEPTGNLDSTTGEEIIHILQSLNGHGLTIILVTHNLELAEEAHRVIQLRDGMIVDAT
jgi:putative ABC transport system ATP-binding protein